MKRRKAKQVERVVEAVLDSKLKSLLMDVSYRIGVLNEEVKSVAGVAHKITSGMLNIATHQLDGFVITDNSPGAGSIAWTDCHVVYKGTDYVITNGNTNLKYVYWTLGTTPTLFRTSATKPTLTDDDVLICINNGGVHQMVVGSGRMTPGSSIISGTVNSDEIASGAVLTDKIAALAITEGLLSSGSVTVNKLGSNAVDSTKLADNAVTANKIGSGAVTNTKLGSNAVDSAKLADGAVTTAKIGANAVDGAKIATGAVGTTQLADTAVTAGKIATGAVGSTQIGSGAVTQDKIGAGAVVETKLSVALHMLF